MNQNKLHLNQNKLELAVAIGFSIVIFILSSTNLGYVSITPYRSLDMGIIPAIFAAMIGGYRVGIPVSILWAVLAYNNPASNLQYYTLYGLIIDRVVLVTAAYYSYKVCKKLFERSPSNVYRAIFVAVTLKNIVSNMLLYILIGLDFDILNQQKWFSNSMQQYLLELALCSLAMMFLIKHLRQVHILNGVRRKEKMRSGLQSTVHHEHSQPSAHKD